MNCSKQEGNFKVVARKRNDHEIEVGNSSRIQVSDIISDTLLPNLLLKQKIETGTSPLVIARIHTSSKKMPFLEFRLGTETQNVYIDDNEYGHEDRGNKTFIKLYAIGLKGAVFLTDFECRILKKSIYRDAYFTNLKDAEKTHRVCYGQYLEHFERDLTSFIITYLKSLPYPKED